MQAGDPLQIFVSGGSIGETIRAERLSLVQLPRFVRDSGFDGIELSDRLFVAYDTRVIEQFARQCIRTDCGFVLDVNCDLTLAADRARRREIDHVVKMIELARRMRARVVRICLGGQSLSIQKLIARRRDVAGAEPNSTGLLFGRRRTLRLAHALRTRLPSRVARAEEKTARAIAALREIAPLLDEHRLGLAIENHWGITGRPENILHIVDASGSERIGTCPDFANFPADVDRYEGLRALAPAALQVHAQSARFAVSGEERTIDYGRCLRILRESGYHGAFTIEFHGAGDELSGCQSTKRLLLKYWS